jgi:hypothetical protein
MKEERKGNRREKERRQKGGGEGREKINLQKSVVEYEGW